MALENSNQKELNPARAGSYTNPAGKDLPKKQLHGLATVAKLDGGEGDYNISSHSYPIDLYSNKKEYGGNYVVFYINVAGDSKLLSEDKVKVFSGEVPPRLRGPIAGQEYSKKEAIFGAALTGAVTTAGITSVSSITSAKTDLKTFAKNTLVGAGVYGAAAGIVAGSAGGKMSRQQVRLDTAIALHVPNNLSISYSMDWQTDSTFAFQAGAVASREVAKAINTTQNKSNFFGGPIGDIATNIALQTPGIGSALSAASGLANNPKKEQIFKNVNYREFTFDYQFAPRNDKEARAVRQIIKMFKLHMHPEFKDANNFVYIYPSEFDIYYYNGGVENLHLNRHTSCVLKDMIINYTPNGIFNTFEDGMPTVINVQLKFLELAILTKANIKDGF